jgi:hypothetical protein
MQSDARASHFLHAFFNLAFPESRTILFQPEHDLSQLLVEC